MLCGSLDGGGQFGKEWIHVYVCLHPFVVYLKLSQHCLLISYTTIRNKKLKKEKKKKQMSTMLWMLVRADLFTQPTEVKR